VNINPVEAQAAQMLATMAPSSAAAQRAIGQVLGVGVTDDFEQWWEDQDPDAVLAAAGGWSQNVDTRVFWIWVPAALTLFCVGWFWSLALLRLPRRWVLLWIVPLMLLAAFFVGLLAYDWMSDNPNWYWQAARRQISPPVAALTYAFAFLPLLAGLYYGRPVTRLAIRALLPPSMRGALAYVWTAEGLEVPTARRASSD
jgi:hypothetical protein